MGCWCVRRGGLLAGAAVVAILCGFVGCQSGPGVSGGRLLAHQATISPAGLTPMCSWQPVNVQCAVPQNWHTLPLNKSLLYTHQQWRSPTKKTGVGVAYVHMPLPLSAQTVIWFAKNEYSKKSNDGKLLGEWTDSFGRPWFEAQNNKYHVRGYVVTHGLDAWIIYAGYRTSSAPVPDELSLASRCLETILPKPLLGKAAKGTQTASAD